MLAGSLLLASAQPFVPRPAPVEKGREAPSSQSIDQVERDHILEVLMRTNWREGGGQQRC